MEDPTVTNEHGGKKKIHLISSRPRNGGDAGAGIAGLLVFGGALAVAGVVAVASFASNKNKAKGKSAHHHQPEAETQQLLLDDHETTQSLPSLLQDSTIQDGDAICCSNCLTSNKSTSQISSSELLSTQTMILDEKIDQQESPTCFHHDHHQEIALSDDSHPESATSSNENEVGGGECLESLLNNASSQAQELDKDDKPQDGLKSIEIETETEEDDISEDDEESDGVSESGEEDSSNATGSTSLDSNGDQVWPAELIQEPVQELRGEIIDTHSQAQRTAKTNIALSVYADSLYSHVCSDGDADGWDYPKNEAATSVTPEATLNEKANFSVGLSDQPSALRSRVIPMLFLALLLLLVLLTHQPQESMDVLDDGSNSVIASQTAFS